MIYTAEEWREKQEKEIADRVATTPLIILEFYTRIDMPGDDCTDGYSFAARCEAVMSSYNSEDGFKWHCANLQVFHEDHRIAVYEGTPGIGLYGASHAVELPFDAFIMHSLVSKAESMFPMALARLKNPER